MQAQEVFDGRYRLVQQLGSGGSGTVWEAFDTRMQRPVALKVANFSDGELDGELFLREALTAGGLSHPHIVTVYDYGTVTHTSTREDQQPQVYVVMELIDGEPLDTVLGRGTPPLSQALIWAAQVCEALDAAHRRGIVHRDIKPANTLIAADGRAKVVDFGIAKNLTSARKLTPTGLIMGSFPYVAPELFRGHEPEPRCDLYSLGCMLTELCTGRPPFDGVTPVNLMYQHTEQTPPAPSGRRPEIPGAVDDLVLRLLAKTPGERPHDAAEVRDRLRELAGSEEVRAARAGPVQRRTQAPPEAGTGTSGAGDDAHATNAAPRVPAPDPTVERDKPERLQPPLGDAGPGRSEPSAGKDGPKPETAAPAAPDSAESASAPVSPNSPGRRRAMTAGVAAVVLLVAATSWLLARQSSDEPTQKNRAAHHSDQGESRGAEPGATPAEASNDQRPPDDGHVTPGPSKTRKSPTSTPDKPRDGSSPASRQLSLVRVGQFNGYTCPYGKACLFEGWNGTGWMGYAPDCGTIDLASLRHMVSSVKTHGNAVTLYDDSHKQVGKVPDWTQTNLSSPEESDQAVTAYVHC